MKKLLLTLTLLNTTTYSYTMNDNETNATQEKETSPALFMLSPENVMTLFTTGKLERKDIDWRYIEKRKYEARIRKHHRQNMRETDEKKITPFHRLPSPICALM